jgi:hypothetical protein
MAFLRKKTSEGNIGLLYSIIQKTIRRGLENECLYYSKILFDEGTPNSLRKRLIYVTNEDIGHIELSNEIMNCDDVDLFKYVVICCRLQKTHDPAWLSRLALHYCMNDLETDNFELIEAKKMTFLVKDKKYKEIREYLGKYGKMYTFTSKNNLVWSSYILFKNRKELNQNYSLEVDIPEVFKFNEIPYWVKDKHVVGGVKGYKFFFENSLVVLENIYENMLGEGGDKYADECKKVYLDDEKKLGNGKTNYLKKIWLNSKDNYETIIKGYKDVIQVQLITSRGKPQVYFVTDINDNKKYVLKGPIIYDMKKKINKTELMKKKLGMNTLNVTFIKLDGKIWMKSDCILDYNKDNKELKSSKLESNIYIYSGDNSNINFDMISKNFMEIFEQYLFRIFIGCNDHCVRNIIEKDLKFYSIDDHCLDIDVNLDELNKIKMRKDIKIIWDNKIKENKDNIFKILKDWEGNVETDYYKKRLTNLMELF